MKQQFLRLPLVVTAFFAVTLFFYSCKKDLTGASTVPAGTTKFSVFLADDPVNYQKVLIDIQQIAVKVDTCLSNADSDPSQPGCDENHDVRHSNCEIWDTLAIHPGVYDLLTLRNGLDTLLASGFVLNGKIERIQLTLGSRDSVEVDSTVYPLQLAGNQPFVYVNIAREHLDSLSANNFQMYLDFDLSHSIRYFNGGYWLRPVLNPFGLHNTGEIEGNIRPLRSFGMVKAYNATDSGFALPEDHGRFEIRGLNPGSYTLDVTGINGYQDTTITNITVIQKAATTVGTIQLHQ